MSDAQIRQVLNDIIEQMLEDNQTYDHLINVRRYIKIQIRWIKHQFKDVLEDEIDIDNIILPAISETNVKINIVEEYPDIDYSDLEDV